MALEGFKDQTQDIDVLRPGTLLSPLKDAITHVSRAQRLPLEWINTHAASVLRKAKPSKRLPDYFNEISRTIEIGKNLTISVIGRQALLSLKLWAANPSYTKHTADLKKLRPNQEEMKEAVSFVLGIDNTELRRNDLRILLNLMGFDFDELTGNKR
jgi:hypothetical protein